MGDVRVRRGPASKVARATRAGAAGGLGGAEMARTLTFRY